MVVKNEAARIVGCLSPIVDLFEQVIVVDTGSTDGTPELLRRQFGIEPLTVALDESRCACLCDPRCAGLEQLSTPWNMFLDADELIASGALEEIMTLPDDPDVAGYFGRWVNHVGDDAPFDDYKLFLFRRGLRSVGLVHDVVQLDIRARGMQASWLDELVVRHRPDPDRLSTKVEAYRRRLQCAIERQPDFSRYHWFMGYMDFRQGRLDEAVVSLSRAAQERAPAFPVECLNSSMVLAEIFARRDLRAPLAETLQRAWCFYQDVIDDFEVRVNFRLGDWLAAAMQHCAAHRLDKIRAYRFAC